jgi:hypothetical protein
LAIKRWQIYFSLTVINCEGSPQDYPAEPYVAGERATHFKFSVPDDGAEFTGIIPAKVFKEYRRPCVFLEGGSYLLRKIKSDTVPLKKFSTTAPKAR